MTRDELNLLSFSKPIAKWNIKDAPITQHKRFMEYKEIGLGMIALLESEKDGVGEILRKLSETLRNATAMEFYFRRRFFYA